MDHLMLLNRGPWEPTRIPFLASTDAASGYDFGYFLFNNDFRHFEDFHERRGYSLDSDYSGRSEKEIAAFAQTWLYFGVLSEFIKRPVDHEMFLVQEALSDGSIDSWLSSQRLPELISQHRLSLPQNDRGDTTRLHKLTVLAGAKCATLEGKCCDAKGPLPEVLLGIRLLLDTLWATCVRIQQWIPTPLIRRPMGLVKHTATSSFLTRELEKKGWCPFQVNQLLCNFSYSMASYLLAQGHRTGRPTINHNACCYERCVALNIDSKTYRTLHPRPECSSKPCPFRSVSRKRVGEIIDRGGIPLVSIIQHSTGEIKLIVKAKHITDQYIAISHVWSDGMGNQEDNSLPECQLKRLSRHIAELPAVASDNESLSAVTQSLRGQAICRRTRWFWLDTLLIPVGDDEPTKLLRKIAISKIPVVYSGAFQVLVLDSELEHFDRIGSSWTQVAAKALFSAWAGRSWTFEEAALSQVCNLRFAGGWLNPVAEAHEDDPTEIVPTRSLWGAVLPMIKRRVRSSQARYQLLKIEAEDEEPVGPIEMDRFVYKKMESMLNNPLRRAFQQMCPAERKLSSFSTHAPPNILDQFLYCWNVLGERTTSHEEDKLVIMAHMLDLNSFQITNKAPPQRLTSHEEPRRQEELAAPRKELLQGLQMLRLLQSLKVLPLYLLLNDGPRVNDAQTPRNRWIPLYPSALRLDARPTMTWGAKGIDFSRTSAESHNGASGLWFIRHGPMKLDLFRDLLLTKTTFANSWTLEQKKFYFNIHFLRSANDGLLEGSYKATIFLLEGGLQMTASTGALTSRGACFQITEIVEDDCDCTRRGYGYHEERCKRCVHMVGVYDCPIQLTMDVPAEQTNGRSVIEYELLSEWTMNMEYDALEEPQTFSKRPAFPAASFRRIESLALAPFYLIEFASFILFTILLAKSNTQHSVASRIIIYLAFILGRLIGKTLYRAVCLVAITLVYIAAYRGMHDLSRLDIAFAVLSFLGNGGFALTYIILYFIFLPRIYREWLDTFGPDWCTTTDTKLLEKLNAFESTFTTHDS